MTMARLPTELKSWAGGGAADCGDQGHAPGVALGDREGEHALQPFGRALAPGVPGLQHHLGVAVGEKGVAQRAQFLAQFPVVVDAAVEHHRQPEHGIGHGLLGALGQVDDLQAPLPERDAPMHVQPGAVRATRGLAGVHCVHGAGRGEAAVESQLPCDSTHNQSLVLIFKWLYYIFLLL
jgi:hypothetical protein